MLRAYAFWPRHEHKGLTGAERAHHGVEEVDSQVRCERPGDVPQGGPALYYRPREGLRTQGLELLHHLQPVRYLHWLRLVPEFPRPKRLVAMSWHP